MPILSLNFGLSKFTALYLDDKNNQIYWTYDYTYQKSLFSHFYSQDGFYTDVFNLFLKVNKIKLDNTAILTTGYNLPITIGRNIDLSLSIEEIVAKLEKFYTVFFDKDKIITQKGIFGNEDNIVEGLSSRERDFMVNYSFYKNIKPTNLSQYEALLSKIYKDVSSLELMKDSSNIPTLFVGDFLDAKSNDYLFLSYFYLISMMSKKGVYKIYSDPYDKIIHFKLISLYNQQYQNLLDSYEPISLGTLLNYPGEISCLIKNEISNPQLIDLKPGQIFFLPVDASANLSINVKSGADIFEQNIQGGKIGLIIDTRTKDPVTYNHEMMKKDIELNLKNLEEALSRI